VEGRSFPIFFRAYTGKVGGLAGTAQIASADTFPLSGDLHWQKPGGSRPPYSGGLTHEPIEMSGNVYTPPRRQRVLDDFDATQGLASFVFSGSVSDPVSMNAAWNQNNTIRFILPSFTRAKAPRVTLRPGTGLFMALIATVKIVRTSSMESVSSKWIRARIWQSVSTWKARPPAELKSSRFRR
jgi:hypothetical protein